MNYIDIFFVVLVVLTVWAGYARGLFVSLISLLRFAVGVPLAFALSSKYNGCVYNEFVREFALNKITEKLSSSADIDAFAESVREAAAELPFGLENVLDLSFLDNVSNSSAVDLIMQNIVEPAALVIIKIFMFVLTIAVFYVITGIIIALIKKLERKEHVPFKKTNKFLGAVFGLAKSVIAVMAIAAIFNFVLDVYGNTSDSAFIIQLSSSSVLDIINKYNPILYIIQEN